jgi:hypothetical protein
MNRLRVWLAKVEDRKVGTQLRQYMGDRHPVLPARIDPWRWVNPTTAEITNLRFTPRGELHWVVAVLDRCPYCGGEHEHQMAARVGWGHYRAGCSKLDNSRSYYLTTT